MMAQQLHASNRVGSFRLDLEEEYCSDDEEVSPVQPEIASDKRSGHELLPERIAAGVVGKKGPRHRFNPGNGCFA